MSENSKFVLYLSTHESVDMSVCPFPGGTEPPLLPGYVSGPFIRDCFIFQYCIHGRGAIVINDSSFPIRRGQLYVMFPGSVVYMKADANDPWAKTWVCLYGQKVGAYLSEMGVTENNPVFPWSDNPEVLEHMLRIIDECAPSSGCNRFDKVALANKLFSLLWTAVRAYQTDYSDANKSTYYVQKAIEFIDTNSSPRTTVEDVAAHLGLNRAYFSSLFKQYTNSSPLDYIHQRKIRVACDFFTNPKATVASVAHALGYDPHVFTRIFKKIKGFTPMEYKNILAAARDDLRGDEG